MRGLAAMAFGGAFVSCSHDMELDGGVQQSIQETYEEAFKTRFGEPAATQDWGFGTRATATKAMTRSQIAPVCPDIPQPYDGAWVANYNETAKEPTSANIWDNHDDSSYTTNWNVVNAMDWNDPDQVADRRQAFDSGLTWDETVAFLKSKRPEWLTYAPDETYVLDFKITGTYDGYINVATSEGIMDDGTLSGAERTIVVTGTWNITEDQRIGSLGKIIIADGGTVNVAAGKTLNMVNQARLVVLPGGKLTGAGKVEVNNGNDAGKENYNGGTIDVAVFNNNFGKFYNYGDFLVTEYQGGAKESNFYNHHLVSIKHTGLGSETPNARIFNACQWYCEGDMRCRNYEGVQGSSFIVGGQLMVSGSEDGTTTPSYFGLAAGALVQAGSLYNNGTSWTGPTEGGYAVLSIGKFDFMNWEQDAPQNGGYFINNIYLQADDLSNVPGGNGMHQESDNGTEYYTMSQAEWKFKNIVANAGGNGNVEVVKKGDYEVIPADEGFVLGKAGCTPGFKISKENNDPDPTPTPDTNIEKIRVIAEDLTVDTNTDFDFNDVVFDVIWNKQTSEVSVVLKAAGGTLPLYIDGREVHDLYSEIDPTITRKTMVNTYAENKGLNGKSGLPDITFTVSAWSGSTIREIANSISVYVTKTINGEEVNCQLTAPVGSVASKVAVGTDYDWCNERQDIDQKYSLSDGTSLFKEYVKGLRGDKWYMEFNKK